MKHLFVPYELALLAKEKGFDAECLRFYGDDKVLYNDEDISNSTVNELYCTAPLWQQLVDWFREVHKIHIEIRFGLDDDRFLYQGIINDESPYLDKLWNSNYYSSLEESIKEAFKRIK